MIPELVEQFAKVLWRVDGKGNWPQDPNHPHRQQYLDRAQECSRYMREDFVLHLPADAQDEVLGKLVRRVWVQWAQELTDPKPSWLIPWHELDEDQQDIDMQIGSELFELGRRVGRQER